MLRGYYSYVRDSGMPGRHESKVDNMEYKSTSKQHEQRVAKAVLQTEVWSLVLDQMTMTDEMRVHTSEGRMALKSIISIQENA